MSLFFCDVPPKDDQSSPDLVLQESGSKYSNRFYAIAFVVIWNNISIYGMIVISNFLWIIS